MKTAGWIIWDVMVAVYLVEILAIWPVLVVLWKLVYSCRTWTDANRQTWARWNEIRTSRGLAL